MTTLASRVGLSWTTLAKRDMEVYRRSGYRVVLQLVRMNAESLDESPTVGMGVGKEEGEEGRVGGGRSVDLEAMLWYLEAMFWYLEKQEKETRERP
ncbi:hypothetical protein ACFX11_020245 [Malus domestica]